LQKKAGEGDTDAADELKLSSHILYAQIDPKRRAHNMDLIIVTREIVEMRLIQTQIKSTNELEVDMEVAKVASPECDNWEKYLTKKLGSNLSDYNSKLKAAYDANDKRSMKHTDQAKKCLDCLALLGEIKKIPDAEAAIKAFDYHRCFMAVDNFYMRAGGNDNELFRKEVELIRIQHGQDLNSHLDILQSSIERWQNIEHMERKLLDLGSMPEKGLSASKFVLDHPEVAIDNSYDLTDAEILAKGDPSIVLLSENKRFTLYSNSVKSNPRFTRIVEEFHTRNESERTVKALLMSLRNFEISASGTDKLAEERAENKDWLQDLNVYLDIVLKRLPIDPTIISVKEKPSAHFTVADESSAKTDTQGSYRSKLDLQRSSQYEPRNQSEVRDGDIPRCTNHPASTTHWTWECKGGKKAAASDSKAPNKPTGEKKKGATGCAYCFNIPRLRKNSLNHSSNDCRMNRDNLRASSSSSSSSAFSTQIKDAVRAVLQEEVGKKRSYEEDVTEEPGRAYGSDDGTVEMDEDTFAVKKTNKKSKK